MSDAKPDLSKFTPLRFILSVQDIKGVTHESEEHGYDENNPLKVPKGEILLCLGIENQKTHPSGSLEISGFKSEGNCNGDLYTRGFDTEKRSHVKVSLPSGETYDMNREAWSREMFIFEHCQLQPGKSEFKVTGPIYFKYLDKKRNAHGSEELDITLSFWLEGEEEADLKPPTSTADPVVPNSEANKTEKESKQMSS